ncbi:RNA polymerase sigma factor [Streptomyces sp. NPDC091209]|uniref:RNA polymerase sigma factor n=1 Tax=Streptomyces sp. NPDC091209 TaxID=3365974 RepID=UPI003810DB5E
MKTDTDTEAESETDEELLTRSVSDPVAFEPLVARHSTALHGFLLRRAPGAADDLLSETWLQAFRGRAGFDPGRGTVRGWLFGVARVVVAGHWRGAPRDLGIPSPSEGSTDPWGAVDQRLDAAAVAPLMRRVLAGMPEVERQLLLLVVWDQLTPAEAATAVGVPPGTARSRLHRARKRLREALGAGQGTDTEAELTAGDLT